MTMMLKPDHLEIERYARAQQVAYIPKHAVYFELIIFYHLLHQNRSI